jgi:hypothetical protein
MRLVSIHCLGSPLFLVGAGLIESRWQVMVARAGSLRLRYRVHALLLTEQAEPNRQDRMPYVPFATASATSWACCSSGDACALRADFAAICRFWTLVDPGRRR